MILNLKMMFNVAKISLFVVICKILQMFFLACTVIYAGMGENRPRLRAYGHCVRRLRLDASRRRRMNSRNVNPHSDEPP